jgi:hypothetical protein
MTHEIRWRILTLQVVAIVVLAFCAGIGYWANGFIHSEVSKQLKQQQITFPVANSPAIKALPAANASEMTKYAGQQLTTGDQARTYAENFIAVHLNEIGQGKPYSYWSGKALTEQQSNPKQYAIDENTALTLFRGVTLRTMLNQAWAFWFTGQLALYAAIGLTVAAIVVLGAFLFELLVAPRRETIGKPRVAGKPVSVTPA